MNMKEEKDSGVQTSDFVAFLHTQIEKAEKFTKDFIDRNKRDVKLYNGEVVSGVSTSSHADSSGDIVTQYQNDLDKRYRVASRMIFTNTEGAKSTIFDRLPELVFKARNEEGDQKQQLIMGIYEYLKDRLDLYAFAMDSLHWFILSGFVCGYVDYQVASYEAQSFGDDNEPVFDEFGNPVTYTKYEWDDPMLTTGDPTKNFFAPSSKYSVDMDKVPFNVKKENINVDQLNEVYSTVVEADSVENDSSDGDKTSNMATVWFYCGTIPEEQKEEVENWEVDAEYYIVLTKDKILYQKRRKRRQSKLAKWYSSPNEFFGFGFGKIGEPYQGTQEQRRGQISRAADYLAFPKLAFKNDGEELANPEDWKDPRENLTVMYTSNKPEYLTPPGIGDTVMSDLELNDAESQAAFGMLDISTGAQEASTVQTATGQTIFAEAAQKRMKYAKRVFMAYYREIVIELFKQCQENWTDPKPITITDEDGNTQEVRITKEELADIDFDKDLDIDAESTTVNKDVLREQMIALYDKVKDDPLVDRKKVFSDMLRKGFDINNPDRYVKEASGVEPGTVLMNPETGEQFTVGDSGEVISAQEEQEMAEPGGERAPQTQGATLNTVGA